MQKTTLLTILLLLASFFETAYADTLAKVDSLLEIYHHGQDRQRTAVARQLLTLLSDDNLFFSPPPTLSAGMSRDEEQLTVGFVVERFLTTSSYYQEALTHIDQSLHLAEEIGKKKQSVLANLPDWHATLLCDKCYCLFKTSNYADAINVGMEAVDYCQQQKNLMQLSRAYLYISLVNHGLRNYDDALVLVEKAISTDKELTAATNRPSPTTHNILGIACELYCSALQIDKAIDYGLQAVEAARAVDNKSAIANHLTQLSYAYDRKGEYQRGLQAADSAIKLVREEDPLDRNQLAISLEFKGWNLIDLGRQREAVEALREAIAMQQAVGNIQSVSYDYRTLSEALEAVDLKESLAALKRYIKLNDSLHTVQLKEFTTKANTDLHVDELEEQNAQSQRTNRIILMSSLTFMLMLIGLIAALMYALRQRKKTTAILQQLTSIREEFFTNVTHELRTPLTVILGLARELQTLSSPIPEEEVKQRSMTIEHQGNQLLQLVNQMLDITKVKSAIGHQPVEVGNIDAYVAMVTERYRELARQKDVSLVYQSELNDVEAEYVPDYMDKLLGNLLSNAIKFTPSGGQVKVMFQQAKTGVLLTVSDNGIGIPADKLAHIFEPFYQADYSTSNVGTGVGLALVKQITDALHGTISVESTPEKGTTFAVSLPIVTAPGQKAPEEPERPLPHTATTQQPDKAPLKPCLLIVEDNNDVAALIGRQLGNSYELHYATDGLQALSKVKETIPDLIITDLMMPHMDGLQLCRAIRDDEATNHIPIIVVTAKATEPDRIKGRQAGADEYLYKPFNAEELNLCVENLLGARSRLRQKLTLQLPEPAVPLAQPTPATAERPVPEEAEPYPFTNPSEEFVSKVRKAIVELMPKRQADVEHVASSLCISPFQLRAKLTSVTGITPIKYILQVRLEEARRMLDEQPDRTIADIGESCGFYDKSHFSRSFHAAFGLTPGNYIKRKDDANNA